MKFTLHIKFCYVQGVDFTFFFFLFRLKVTNTFVLLSCPLRHALTSVDTTMLLAAMPSS